MTDSSGIANKTWQAFKRTASGLGGSRKSHDGASLESLSPKSSSGATRWGSGRFQSKVSGLDGRVEVIREEAQNGHSPPQPDSRAEFLEAYDAATIELLNRVYGAEVSCVADMQLQSVAPWNRVPGFLGHLSDGQEQALKQMRSWFPESRKFHSDHDILRFLRARDFDAKKTREMYHKYVNEYRGRQMMTPNPIVRTTQCPFDCQLFRLFPVRDPAVTDRMRKLVDWFLHTMVFGADRDGRPVVYFRPADILTNSMIKHVPTADRIAFQSAANEALLILVKLASHKAGFHIENITQVVDLSGMSAMQMVAHMRSADAQQEWQHNMDFMPEILHKVYVINAPSGMSMVWKMASYFLPAHTKRKVNVLGSNYKSELDKAIGRENMPSCYGGECQYEWHQHRSVKELKY